jgi:hypothetical protein
MSCSFIDEYNEHLAPTKHPEFADRIKRLKQITKPVISRINRWKDLKDYRNNVLAHNLRIKEESFFSKGFKKKFYNAPHSNSEIIFLAKLLPIITNCIAIEFPEVLQRIDIQETLHTKMEHEYITIDIEKEIADLWSAINLIKASSN